MRPVRLACDSPFIHTSPRTVALTDGNSVIVLPLWNASPVTSPTDPRVTPSEASVFTLVLVCTMLLFGSPLTPKCTPSRWVGSIAFQICGESAPSLLRAAPDGEIAPVQDVSAVPAVMPVCAGDGVG